MRYRRHPIEIESPEQVGYERIRCNLAESSVADVRLGDLGVALDDLVLQYGDHLGHEGLRALVAATAPGLRHEQVLLLPGAAAALFVVATSIAREGDHVVVAGPNYATNLETPRAIGAEVTTLDLRYEERWQVDVERLRALLRPETVLVSLTTPHNPTGQVLDEETLRDVVGLVEAHPRARLLVDETYRDLSYAPPPPLVASLSERAIGVSSMSKAYGLPGIRLGWLVTRDPALFETLLAAKEQILITGSVVDEAIGYETLRRRDEFLPSIRERVGAALALVREWLAGQDVFEWVEPGGGAVGLVRPRPAHDLDAESFHRTLFEHHGTLVGRGRWFELPDAWFRLGFGWPPLPELEEGLAALSAAASTRGG